jgi:F420-dependent oxidoreductase-like protein
MTLTFGTFLPQGWTSELATITGSSRQWEFIVETCELIEHLGFDAVWVYDHFHNCPEPANESMFEGWMTIAALSQRTSRIRIGHMVNAVTHRSPAVLAKMAATLDVICAGRLDFGIGAGALEGEHRAQGIAFPSNGERIEMLEEAVLIVHSLWANPSTSFTGKHYSLAEAQCDPKPVQHPRPTTWIAGGGEKKTLRVVAQYADVSNFGHSVDEFVHKSNCLAAHCVDVDRDFDSIRRTIYAPVLLRSAQAELKAVGNRSVWGETDQEWYADNFVGTPEQVAEALQQYVHKGCGGFMLVPLDYPDRETVSLCTEVMKFLR